MDLINGSIKKIILEGNLIGIIKFIILLNEINHLCLYFCNGTLVIIAVIRNVGVKHLQWRLSLR